MSVYEALRSLLRPRRPRPDPKALRKMSRAKEVNYETLRRYAVESGDEELLGFVDRRQQALEMLKAEYDVVSGGRDA